VVPKEFSRNILDIESESFGRIMETVRRLSRVIRNELGADGINIRMNNEPAAGQVVFRTHVHIIPRYASDGLVDWKGADAVPPESKALAERIRNACAAS
jgi:histidine triad (HIT) family protein